MPLGLYVRTDTAEDAVSSFELAAEFFAQTEFDPRYWKWFVVALHAGFQGFFALALEGGNGLLVQKPGVTKAILSAWEANTPHPSPHMDNFLKLFKKVQSKENLRGPSSVPFLSNQNYDQAFESLDQLRDDFIHFNTKSWSIEVCLIIERAAQCLEVADFLLAKSHSILWHEEATELRAHSAIQKLTHAIALRG